MKTLLAIIATASIVWGIMIYQTPWVKSWLLIQEINSRFANGEISYGDSVHLQNQVHEHMKLHQSVEFDQSIIKERLVHE